MTEVEWNTCTDPAVMLEFLRDKASKRKQRLLIVGECRRLWNLLSEWGRGAVEVAERFADGHATAQELEEASGIADGNSVEEDGLYQQAEQDRCLPRSPEEDELFLRELDHRRDRLHAAMLAHTSTFCHERLEARLIAEVVPQQNAVALVQCVFGNPFRPISIGTSLLNETRFRLARSIYEERAFDRLPILADALEEAGCTNQKLLGHCRGAGEHVRGCWCLDLILGRE